MTQPAEIKKRRARDPESTRADILDAALALMARDGPDALSLSSVAVAAGVNRGTAYQHFENREKLVEATLQLVSDRMFRAVFGDPEIVGERDVEVVDMVEVTERLAFFAMDNPELCRIWLMQMIATPDPSSDPFWREYVGSIYRFAETRLAEPGIDVEAWAIVTLAGNFLWPVWARAHSQNEEERQALARRFAEEMLRLSLHGTLQESENPNVVARLARKETVHAPLRLVN
jgi:AcrR family transcriptional regulator